MTLEDPEPGSIVEDRMDCGAEFGPANHPVAIAAEPEQARRPPGMDPQLPVVAGRGRIQEAGPG